MSLILFILGINSFFILFFYLIELFTGLLGVVFISDYFFYAFICQLALGTFFKVSVPSSANYLKNSPNKETRMSASLAGKVKNEETNITNDIGLSGKLFLSSVISLLACIVL